MTKLLPASGTATVAIIGGGLSGAAVAYRLAQESAALALRIVVIEPRAQIGRGLAYSTPDPDHRLNVPHTKMSLRTDVPEHFARWLASPRGPVLPAGSATLSGLTFVPRFVFGDYVAESLAPLLEGRRIVHLRGRATDLRRSGSRYRVTLTSGPDVLADAVVLAIAHPEPAVPAALRRLEGSDALIRDPFAPDALAAIRPDQRVLIVGSGLTSADVLATLDRRGIAAEIRVLSRHGLRSRPHGPNQPETTEDFLVEPAGTALALLRRVRRALADDADRGLTWHAVFDRLRVQGPGIWAALPLSERHRFLRHLRGLWDVHRFRIAPQTFAAVARMERQRRVRFLTGRLVSAEMEGRGVQLFWRPRGAPGLSTMTVDRVVLATGPDHARVVETNPLLRSMAEAGLIGPDPLRLGLCTAAEGGAIAPRGGVVPRLYVAGPLARGTAGELMGVPEVTAWAEHIAARVLQDVRSHLPSPAASGARG